MSKVLTYHKLTGGEHWFTTNVSGYAKKEIEAIRDPEGGNTQHPPTSIPSPFARFDLVRTAFNNLTQRPNLTGTPNDERLVSECFDVGEIFFNFDKLREHVRIIPWSMETDLPHLMNGNKAHRRLGEAFKLYFKQDGAEYNFGDINRLFMLYYEGPKGSGYVGGTSPSTLFFSSPNPLDFVDIRFGNDRLFDKEYCPLHRRDIQYQKFWHYLGKQEGFRKKFKEVSEYLQKSLALLQKENPALWRELGHDAEKLTRESFEKEFERLDTGAPNDPVEVLGYPLWKTRPNVAEIARSGFIIASEKYKRLFPDRPVPMALQNKFGNPKVLYNRANWDPNQEVPPYDNNPWRDNKRRLPGQTDLYPWLTVSDFLEPYLIRLVYPINAKSFFDGGLKGSDVKKSYLLPLKKDFFDFFDTTDLVRGNRVAIKINERAGGMVQVELRLPIDAEGESVVFSRLYLPPDTSTAPRRPNLDKNEGVVVEHQFGITIMPFVRVVAPDFKPDYRVHLVDRDVDELTYHHRYQLHFYNADNKPLRVAPPKNRSEKNRNKGATSQVYVIEEQDFDYIAVEVAGRQGLILPQFPVVPMGDDVFTFAVDLGTTNTHIEYRSTNQPQPRPFEVSERDVQIATLHDPVMEEKDRSLNQTRATAILDLVPMELLPENIGSKHLAKFPQRTALLESRPDYSTNLHGMADFNISFLYERKNIGGDYRVSTNLKWENYRRDPKAERRIVGYIDSLMLLIRNKVLLSGGDLAQTELMWFYPTSMLENRRNFFEEVWNRAYRRYISSSKVPRIVPESIAPYYWYSRQGDVKTAEYPAVSVDIGGGTTDVVIFANDEPILMSSFRFAANSVFGDGYAQHGAASRNGFVRKYGEEIYKTLESNGFGDLTSAYRTIRETERSTDIIAFLFSLRENKRVTEKTTIDFNQMLARDESLKIVFVVFYAAIVYHIAQVMKVKGMKMPRYMAFSGMGSRILDILSTKPTTLAQMAQLIFERVYGRGYHEDGLDVVKQALPKEATCKGGLRLPGIDFTRGDDGKWDRKIEKTRTIWLGTADGRLVSKVDTYQSIDQYVPKVAEEMRQFVDMLFGLHDDFSFNTKFGINVGMLEHYKRLLLKDLVQNIREGVELKKGELASVSEPVEETLFFYPLIGALNNLANEITK